MVQECGVDRKEIPIKENGGMANPMVMGSIPGQMEIHIRENSSNV